MCCLSIFHPSYLSGEDNSPSLLELSLVISSEVIFLCLYVFKKVIIWYTQQIYHQCGTALVKNSAMLCCNLNQNPFALLQQGYSMNWWCLNFNKLKSVVVWGLQPPGSQCCRYLGGIILMLGHIPFHHMLINTCSRDSALFLAICYSW